MESAQTPMHHFASTTLLQKPTDVSASRHLRLLNEQNLMDGESTDVVRRDIRLPKCGTLTDRLWPELQQILKWRLLLEETHAVTCEAVKEVSQ